MASNYGEAGALLYYGRALGLPPARSQHNNFYLWGPGPGDYDVFIMVGPSREALLESFEQVEARGVARAEYAIPFESELTIFVCRGLKRPLSEAWRLGKRYI